MGREFIGECSTSGESSELDDYEMELAIKFIKHECGEPPRGVDVLFERLAAHGSPDRQCFVAGSESRLADASQQTKPSSNPSFVQPIRSGAPVYAKCLV